MENARERAIRPVVYDSIYIKFANIFTMKSMQTTVKDTDSLAWVRKGSIYPNLWCNHVVFVHVNSWLTGVIHKWTLVSVIACSKLMVSDDGTKPFWQGLIIIWLSFFVNLFRTRNTVFQVVRYRWTAVNRCIPCLTWKYFDPSPIYVPRGTLSYRHCLFFCMPVEKLDSIPIDNSHSGRWTMKWNWFCVSTCGVYIIAALKWIPIFRRSSIVSLELVCSSVILNREQFITLPSHYFLLVIFSCPRNKIHNRRDSRSPHPSIQKCISLFNTISKYPPIHHYIV